MESIALIEVGGASDCDGLEAEGKESFALYLRKVILKFAPGSDSKPTPQGERS